jgi:hypothetical protein
MQVPPDIAQLRLFKRGVILRSKEKLNTCEKYKYLIVVNLNERDDPIWAVLTTSRTSWYDDHPDVPSVVRIDGNVLDAFPVDTIINCGDLHSLPRQRVIDCYNKGQLTYHGELPKDIMSRVNIALRDSETLSPSKKDKVFRDDLVDEPRPRLCAKRKDG